MFAPSKTYPPITLNVNPRDYHALGPKLPRGDAGKLMSRSELWQFAKCPRRWLLGFREETNGSMDWGNLVDTCVLTPKLFESRYAITPETYPAKGKRKDPDEPRPWTIKANFCKQWEADREAAGKECVKGEGTHAASEAWAASKRIEADLYCRELLKHSDFQVQVCVDWKDEATGLVIPIKALLDIVPRSGPYSGIIFDLKTAKSASQGAWRKAVFNEGYHFQASLYMDALNAAITKASPNVRGFEEFGHVIQENYPPYEIGRRLLSEEYITMGREAYVAALKRYCRCLASNEWPSYDDDGQDAGALEGFSLVQPEPWQVLHQD